MPHDALPMGICCLHGLAFFSHVFRQNGPSNMLLPDMLPKDKPLYNALPHGKLHPRLTVCVCQSHERRACCLLCHCPCVRCLERPLSRGSMRAVQGTLNCRSMGLMLAVCTDEPACKHRCARLPAGLWRQACSSLAWSCAARRPWLPC